MSEPSFFTSQLSAERSTPAAAGFSFKAPALESTQMCSQADVEPTDRTTFRLPCDVLRLELFDAQTAVSLRAGGRLHQRLLGARVPPHLRDDLAQYDLVLERAVDYVGRRIKGTAHDADVPKVKLQMHAAASYAGVCAHVEHPLIEMWPLTPVSSGPKQYSAWRAACTDTMEMVAFPLGEVIDNPAGWLAPFWVLGTNVQEWTLKAASCGIPESGSAVVALTALVRVYPRDEYELSFTWPAAAHFTGEKSASVSATGVYKTKTSSVTKRLGTVVASDERSTVGSDGLDASTTTASTHLYGGSALLGESMTTNTYGLQGIVGEKSKLSVETARPAYGGLVLMRSKSSNERQRVGDEFTEKEEDAVPGNNELLPQVTLKKNGRELDVTKFVNNLLNIAQKVKAAIEDIQNLIPTVGWKATLVVKVMEGSITARWGVQNAEDVYASVGAPLYDYRDERYAAVRRYHAFSIKVVAFGVTATLMFGVEVKVNAVFWQVGELTLKIEGQLKGEVSLAWTTTSDLPTQPPLLNGDFGFSLSGVCRVNAAGQHLIDASAVLAGGLKFTGTPYVSTDHAPSIEASVARLATTLTYYGCVAGEQPDPVVVPLYEGGPVWSGNLFGAAEGKTT